MGPLKTVVGGYNHIFVAIDKFTRWIEVKPVTATTATKASEFHRRNISLIQST